MKYALLLILVATPALASINGECRVLVPETCERVTPETVLQQADGRVAVWVGCSYCDCDVSNPPCRCGSERLDQVLVNVGPDVNRPMFEPVEWARADLQPPSCGYNVRGIDGPAAAIDPEPVAVVVEPGENTLHFVSEDRAWTSRVTFRVRGEDPDPEQPDVGALDGGVPDEQEAEQPAESGDDGCASLGAAAPAFLVFLPLAARRRRTD